MQQVNADQVEGVCIRYGCKCGHFAPLSTMFFSELCRKPVCRLPHCSVEEFEAYYCGYLLVNMPSKEASMYQNRSSRCFSCVCCGNILSTALHESLQRYFFLCAHCRWDSLALDLIEDDPDMLIMSAVAREREAAQEDIFHTLLSYYTTGGTGATTSRSASSSFSGRSISLVMLADSMKELQKEQQMKKFRAQRMVEMGSWKLEHAVEQSKQKEEWLREQRKAHLHPDLAKQLAPLTQPQDPIAKDRLAMQHQAQVADMTQISILSQRFLNPLEQPRDTNRLFPSRPLLRVKRTWRCVESIEKGSAGILVKPQISPMSGDSSMPIPASWFKKANLAVHYMPIMTFQAFPQRSGSTSSIPSGKMMVECVLLVENPVDEALRIVLHAVENDERLNAQVLIEDQTPMLLGPFEDPNIADDRPANAAANATRNTMVVSIKRNLARIKLEMLTSTSVTTIRFGLRVEMEKYDEDLEEPIENSALSFPIEFTAPLQQ